MNITGLGRPPGKNDAYQVFEVRPAGGKPLLAFVTCYDDGRRTWEFDNDRRYTEQEMDQIMQLGKSVTSHWQPK